MNQLLKIVDDQSIDAVLIAGDVYDKANATIEGIASLILNELKPVIEKLSFTCVI